MKIFKTQASNDGSRTLFQSILVPELRKALKDWNERKECVLIGGLALSFHVKPRTTQDIDFLFLKYESVPTEPEGFRKIRPHAFEHKTTGVEVEVLQASFLNLPLSTAKKVFDTAMATSQFRVASKEGLIALKLFRFSRQDQADIEALLEAGADFTMEGWTLPAEHRKRLDSFKS